MSDKIERLQKLKQMLDDGTLSEGEYQKMKAEIVEEENSNASNTSNASTGNSQRRTGNSWQELLGVLLGPLGGIVYTIFTKQKLPKKLIVVVLSFIVGGFYIAFTPEPETTTNGQASSSQTGGKTQGNNNLISTGEWVEYSGRAIKVKNFQELQVLPVQNQFTDDLTTSGKFIRVNLSVKNTSDQTGNMIFSSFILKDKQGRTYNTIDPLDKDGIMMYMQEQDLGKMDQDIYPGGTIQDAILFEVPPDASSFVLKWKGNKIDLSS
jgi:hypothetical protein